MSNVKSGSLVEPQVRLSLLFQRDRRSQIAVSLDFVLVACGGELVLIRPRGCSDLKSRFPNGHDETPSSGGAGHDFVKESNTSVDETFPVIFPKNPAVLLMATARTARCPKKQSTYRTLAFAFLRKKAGSSSYKKRKRK
ncbi:hypothetical protein MPTK2_8g03400 [Marchantia polymorpha subsp. ruderalis]